MEQSVVPKRPREEPLENEDSQDCDESLESSKRHKPYNHILSLLESEEDDSRQDLSPLITALQQEITNYAPDSNTHLSQHNLTPTTTITNNNLEDCSSSTTQSSSDTVEQHAKEGVMRHLLQASMMNLGFQIKGMDHLILVKMCLTVGTYISSICDGLWELEDEAANYYDLLQSQLFL